jgi:hypothetical protein
MRNGFSFSSVILSYFLVGGGLFTGSLVLALMHLDSEAAGYALMGGGAALGGFVAGRASRGETILEPAIGAVAVVATIVALGAGTDAGKTLWAVAQDATIAAIGKVGITTLVGAVLGAYISEKAFGEATLSSVPWIAYTALATFGGSMLSIVVAAMLFFRHAEGAGTADDLAKMMLAGMAIGCLLSGLAVGASARTRPLLAALLGGGAGVGGFLYLCTRASATTDKDAIAGMAIIAAGGAIVTLIGTLVGWVTVGKKG